MKGLKLRDVITVCLAGLALTMPMRAQSNISEVIALDLPSGRTSSELQMPVPRVSRAPVVYLVTDAKSASDLAEALGAQGVATLRRAAPPPPDGAALTPDVAAQ